MEDCCFCFVFAGKISSVDRSRTCTFIPRRLFQALGLPSLHKRQLPADCPGVLVARGDSPTFRVRASGAHCRPCPVRCPGLTPAGGSFHGHAAAAINGRERSPKLSEREINKAESPHGALIAGTGQKRHLLRGHADN